ncbi:uncharacterized protein LOC143007684 [Genypterus blacodes]|uniref:uncharacterized protein LOC143007684 n=1 Tax=Genypterus blacodes TaxID=154954 RepID=UPI003F7781CF
MMGNCISGGMDIVRGRQQHSNTNTAKKPTEDVTYASIDHSNTKASVATRAPSEDDCEYSLVKPTCELGLHPQSESPSHSKEDCADDYVLMG